MFRKILEDQQAEVSHYGPLLLGTLCTVQSVGEAFLRATVSVWQPHTKVWLGPYY